MVMGMKGILSTDRPFMTAMARSFLVMGYYIAAG
jgi:hypothetical protein